MWMMRTELTRAGSRCWYGEQVFREILVAPVGEENS